jgi:hypothetical protein
MKQIPGFATDDIIQGNVLTYQKMGIWKIRFAEQIHAMQVAAKSIIEGIRSGNERWSLGYSGKPGNNPGDKKPEKWVYSSSRFGSSGVYGA